MHVNTGFLFQRPKYPVDNWCQRWCGLSSRWYVCYAKCCPHALHVHVCYQALVSFLDMLVQVQHESLLVSGIQTQSKPYTGIWS